MSGALSSRAFYDALALTYDTLFDAPHRRAYDQLAWELVQQLLPEERACIVDAGCGTGRWSNWLVDLGHMVIGVEESPSMASIARRRVPSERFRLIEASMDRVELAPPVDLVLAMGSLQYTPQPERTLAHMVGWLRPGGWLVVLVDSLVALGLELLAAGKHDEALERLDSRLGCWIVEGRSVRQHLFDAARLEQVLSNAGLAEVQTWGLLIGSSVLGPAGLAEQLATNWEGQLAKERRWSRTQPLVDLGKQLLGVGRRPPGLMHVDRDQSTNAHEQVRRGDDRAGASSIRDAQEPPVHRPQAPVMTIVLTSETALTTTVCSPALVTSVRRVGLACGPE